MFGKNLHALIYYEMH